MKRRVQLIKAGPKKRSALERRLDQSVKNGYCLDGRKVFIGVSLIVISNELSHDNCLAVLPVSFHEVALHFSTILHSLGRFVTFIGLIHWIFKFFRRENRGN
jgi:hypothetical protein